MLIGGNCAESTNTDTCNKCGPGFQRREKESNAAQFECVNPELLDSLYCHDGLDGDTVVLDTGAQCDVCKANAYPYQITRNEIYCVETNNLHLLGLSAANTNIVTDCEI